MFRVRSMYVFRWKLFPPFGCLLWSFHSLLVTALSFVYVLLRNGILSKRLLYQNSHLLLQQRAKITMLITTITVGLISSLLFDLILSQVASKGRFPPALDHYYEKASFSPRAIFRLPKLVNEELLREAQIEYSRSIAGPFKFGQAIDLDINLYRGDGQWRYDPVNDLNRWQVFIESDGAKSLSVLFKEFYLPDQGEFYVIGADDNDENGDRLVLGAFTGAVNHKPDGTFAIQPVPGQRIILEYVEPALDKNSQKESEKVNHLERPRIVVDKIVHGFAGPVGSGACNIDVVCPIGKPYVSTIIAFSYDPLVDMLTCYLSSSLFICQ